MPLFVLFASTFFLQKVNCPELIRLLMSYNFLAEATAVSLDYMNAFMGHGLEYFDIKVVIVGFCCFKLLIFFCSTSCENSTPSTRTVRRCAFPCTSSTVC